MRSILLSLLFIHYLSTALYAQEQRSRSYSMKDGLAGNTVYSVLSDSKGFLWFATDGGLSLFDGTTFRNFSVKDGLEDNDVLSMFEDNEGRIWFYCFNKQPCFYYRGKFYNTHNFPELTKIRNYNWHILYIGIHDIWFSGDKNIYQFSDNKISSYPLPPVSNLYSLTRIENEMYLIADSCLYLLDRKRSCFVKDAQMKLGAMFANQSVDLGEGNYLLIDKHNKKTVIDRCAISVTDHKASRAYCCSYMKEMGNCVVDKKARKLNVFFADNTAMELSLASDTLTPLRSFSTKAIASDIATDIQGNKWVSLLSGGVEMFPANRSVTVSIPGSIKGTSACFSLANFSGQIAAGSNENTFLLLRNGKADELKKIGRYLAVNRVIDMKTDSRGRLWLGTDMGVCIYNPVTAEFNYSGVQENVKDMKYDWKNDRMLLASSFGTFIIPCNNPSASDFISHERSTCIVDDGDGIWYATLNNLFSYNLGKATEEASLMGKINCRITSMVRDQKDRVWATTSGNGVFVVKGKHIIFHFTAAGGLTSDICKNVFIDSEGDGWISTNEGISRIAITGNSCSILKYNDKNCLPDNNINDVLVVNDTVFVGSSSGVTFFDRSNISNNYRIPVYITKIKTGAKEESTEDTLVSIESKLNTVSITFSGLSYVCNGDIQYEYYIAELNDKRLLTRNNSVTFSGLAPGVYNFYVTAIDIFGNRSLNPAHVTFTILPEWYQLLWLRILVAIVVVIIAIAITLFYSRRLEKRRNLRKELEQTISRLELEAIQQQIDPHFIFNCLNAIQGAIYNNNTEVASYFINRFAKLMRKGLMLSKETFISVEEEYDFVSNYLEVEQLRLNKSFDYQISVDSSINRSAPVVPAFILHPFIENAINHGIKYLKDDRGIITVDIIKTDKIEVRITDNGIGVISSKKIKEGSYSGHISKGIELILARVDSLNKIYNRNIAVKISDRSEPDRQSRGTLIMITFDF